MEMSQSVDRRLRFQQIAKSISPPIDASFNLTDIVQILHYIVFQDLPLYVY